MGEREDRTIVARFRRGLVGESERVCHIVPIPDGRPRRLTAYCGVAIAPGQAELITEPRGMPCVHCLANLPAPNPVATTEGRNHWSRA